MDDPVWNDTLARLPPPQPLVLHPVPNDDGEYLTCCLCNRGEDPSRFPPEWLVTHQVDGLTVTRGLHEACRLSHAASRYSKKRLATTPESDGS